jgi:peptidyl-prolyl cis-trans isomerase A (cyclophilin A)
MAALGFDKDCATQDVLFRELLLVKSKTSLPSIKTIVQKTQGSNMVSSFCSFRFRSFLCCLFLGLASAAVGCSEEGNQQPRSVLDSLAEIEKAKKDLAAATPPAPVIPPDQPGRVMEEKMVRTTGSYSVKFETSVGDFVVLVHRDWAPLGAQRFYDLVKSGFYDECRFFRVVSGFMVQFGINGTPATQQNWERPMTDDPARESNRRGYITFATSGPNSRTTQVFINFVDNAFLDSQGFSPFGEVIEGMDNVDKINAEYGESPDQGQINSAGNAYLNSQFPRLDYIKKATIIEE